MVIGLDDAVTRDVGSKQLEYLCSTGIDYNETAFTIEAKKRKF